MGTVRRRLILEDVAKVAHFVFIAASTTAKIRFIPQRLPSQDAETSEMQNQKRSALCLLPAPCGNFALSCALERAHNIRLYIKSHRCSSRPLNLHWIIFAFSCNAFTFSCTVSLTLARCMFLCLHLQVVEGPLNHLRAEKCRTSFFVSFFDIVPREAAWQRHFFSLATFILTLTCDCSMK